MTSIKTHEEWNVLVFVFNQLGLNKNKHCKKYIDYLKLLIKNLSEIIDKQIVDSPQFTKLNYRDLVIINVDSFKPNEFHTPYIILSQKKVCLNLNIPPVIYKHFLGILNIFYIKVHEKSVYMNDLLFLLHIWNIYISNLNYTVI